MLWDIKHTLFTYNSKGHILFVYFLATPEKQQKLALSIFTVVIAVMKIHNY
jgi:hypothetical protein